MVGVFDQRPTAVFDPAAGIARRRWCIATGTSPAAFDRRGLPGLVPGHPPGLVDRLVGQFDDVERIRALAHVRRLGVGGLLVGTAEVERDRLQPSTTGLTQLVVEAFQNLSVAALSGPHHAAALVMVGDHGQVLVALAVRHLINADAQQSRQPGAVDLLADDPRDDPIDGLPAAAQQRADRGLVGVLREPAHHVFEVAAVPGLGPGPRHRLGAHPSTPSAVQPAHLRLQPHLRCSPVQVAPPAHRPVIDTRAALATRTHRPAGTASSQPQN